MKELFELQQKLVATKTNWNDFSKFNYRSLEDILQKAKPLLRELKCVIKLTDEMVMLGDRFYVKSTATLQNENGEKETAIGWAREPSELKGMSEPQVTGTASSYARKYALASLLAIDDNKDVDSLDNRPKQNASVQQNVSEPQKTNLEKLTEYCGKLKLVEGINKTELKSFYDFYSPKVNGWQTFNPETNWKKWMERSKYPISA